MIWKTKGEIIKIQKPTQQVLQKQSKNETTATTKSIDGKTASPKLIWSLYNLFGMIWHPVNMCLKNDRLVFPGLGTNSALD